MKTCYTARDVARIIGIPESRVRYWAQTGFVGPSERLGGRAAYTFGDLVALRAGKELLDRGISLQRARRSLEALRAQLPHLDRPLAQLRIVGDGDRVVVTTTEGSFEPLTGQLVMDFEVASLEGDLAELPHLGDGAAPPPEPTSPYGWFQRGLELERDQGTLAAAIEAYRRAVQGDPQLSAAHTNLGALLFERGATDEARGCFEAALGIDPEQPEARYNFANLLHDTGEPERAVLEWYRVVTACPEFADAHFNLGLAFSRLAAPDRARTHLERYLRLEQDGEWVSRAEALLASL